MNFSTFSNFNDFVGQYCSQSTHIYEIELQIDAIPGQSVL